MPNSHKEETAKNYDEVKAACMFIDDPVEALRRLSALSGQGKLSPEVDVAARGIFQAVKRREIPHDLATHLKQARGPEIGVVVAYVAGNGGEHLKAGEVPGLLNQWWDIERVKSAPVLENEETEGEEIKAGEIEDGGGGDEEVPDGAADRLCAGLAHHEAGEIEEALEAYNEVARLAPDSHIIQYNKGVALADLGRLDEALEAYDEAIRINPEDTATRYNRGVVLAELGRFEDAIEAYDEAMRLDPDDPMVLRARSAALRALGQEEVAQAYADS